MAAPISDLPADLRAYLTFATKLARSAGDMMRANYRSQHTVVHKTDNTPVSEVDTAINTMVIAKVAEEFPTHGVCGEEESFHPERELVWVCDPIDGTVAFLAHVPTSTFMLALVRNGQPQVSVVYNPWTNELFWAAKGCGAWLDGERLQVSVQRPLVVIGGTGTTTSPSFVDSPAGLSWLQDHKWRTVNTSGIGQKGAMVADGGLDGVFYSHTGVHDIAAVSLLVTEAGGRVTDIHGQPQRYDQPIKGAILSNGSIHDQMLELANYLRKDV